MKRRSWFVRHFGWIRDDFRSMVEQLKQVETWVLLGMLAVFFLLAFFAIRLALRSDTMLRALHPATAICRELGENAVAFLFISMIFFGLTVLATLGEFFTYIDSKRHHAHYSARDALKGTAGWGSAALTIGLAVVFFLDSRCI